eukprot:351641-Chlamydomonas_euryale.AAC.2
MSPCRPSGAAAHAPDGPPPPRLHPHLCLRLHSNLHLLRKACQSPLQQPLRPPPTCAAWSATAAVPAPNPRCAVAAAAAVSASAHQQVRPTPPRHARERVRVPRHRAAAPPGRRGRGRRRRRVCGAAYGARRARLLRPQGGGFLPCLSGRKAASLSETFESAGASGARPSGACVEAGVGEMKAAGFASEARSFLLREGRRLASRRAAGGGEPRGAVRAGADGVGRARRKEAAGGAESLRRAWRARQPLGIARAAPGR